MALNLDGALFPIGDSKQGEAAWPRSISLTRNAPAGLGWAIEPTFNKSLEAARQAVDAGGQDEYYLLA